MHRLIGPPPGDQREVGLVPRRLRQLFIEQGLRRKAQQPDAPAPALQPLRRLGQQFRERSALEQREVADRLLPVLRQREREARLSAEALTSELKAAIEPLARRLMAWSAGEREFLDRLNDRGEVAAELITDDAELQERVRRQPMLAWKAENVRKHRGTKGG